MTRSHDEEAAGAPRDLDPELAPVVEALRRMPAVSPGAQARVVAAALGRARRGDGESPRAWWPPSVGLGAVAAAALIAAAGLTLAVRARGSAGDAGGVGAQVAGAARALPPSPAVPPVLVAPPSSTPVAVVSLAGDAAEDAPVLVPFVLRRPGARRVTVVGDFNGWSPTANALAREANGVWTATLPVTPGRHAYGYVVDDTVWVLDQRADRERDADYGRDHSVMVVGRP
jgi:hypothetical protein